jgi:hypothetical protein
MPRNPYLAKFYLDHLLSTPAGRAHVLTLMADAESNGEGQVFDRALARVEDPEVARLIRRHAADEVRHAQLFRDAAARQGVPIREAPANLRLIDRLSRALGGALDQEIQSRTDIMRMYLLLQVIEERALTQFSMFEPAFASVDPVTATTIGQVRRDEERHLKYCHAIARRYAPDAATLAQTLATYRDVEARVFAENSRANLRYAIDHGLCQLRTPARLFYLGLAQLGDFLGLPDRTAFYGRAPEKAVTPTSADVSLEGAVAVA